MSSHRKESRFSAHLSICLIPSADLSSRILVSCEVLLAKVFHNQVRADAALEASNSQS